MKKMILMVAVLLATATGAQDWANYGRYAAANAALERTPEVVFIGNSIVEGWANARPEYFAENNFVGRGIGGQVSAQTLARFRADVLDLHPKRVVMVVGTNDIAENQGPVPLEHVAGNIISMSELAQHHGIEVYICSVLPAAEYPWRREIVDVPTKIKQVNGMVRAWAEANGATYVDFWPAMADERGGLPRTLSEDEVHPTVEGYRIMERVLGF